MLARLTKMELEARNRARSRERSSRMGYLAKLNTVIARTIPPRGFDSNVPTVVAHSANRDIVYAVIALEVGASDIRAVVARTAEDGDAARFVTGEMDIRDDRFAPDLHGVNEYADLTEAWANASARLGAVAGSRPRLACPCGRLYSSLASEYDHIGGTVGREAADEFDRLHDRHEDDE